MTAQLVCNSRSHAGAAVYQEYFSLGIVATSIPTFGIRVHGITDDFGNLVNMGTPLLTQMIASLV